MIILTVLIKWLFIPKCVSEFFRWGRWSGRRPQWKGGCAVVTISKSHFVYFFLLEMCVITVIYINVGELLGQREYTALKNSEAGLSCPHIKKIKYRDDGVSRNSYFPFL